MALCHILTVKLSFTEVHYNIDFVTEYIGNVAAEKREEVIQLLNKEVERLVRVSD